MHGSPLRPLLLPPPFYYSQLPKQRHIPTMGMAPLLLLLLFLLPLSSSSSCNTTADHDLLTTAFAYVSGHVDASRVLTVINSTAGNCITAIRLPSRNLTGTVSWLHLRNVSGLAAVDLSGNSLHGSIPSGFWGSPHLAELNLANNHFGGSVHLDGAGAASALRVLNLSGNRFTNSVRLSGFGALRVLDLSGNRDLRSLPEGIQRMVRLERLDLSRCGTRGMNPRPISALRLLKWLDLSGNDMVGSFPSDFPPIDGLEFLNISGNNFSGSVGTEQYMRFGPSAFAHTRIREVDPPKPKAKRPHRAQAPSSEGEAKTKKKPVMGRACVLGLAIGGAAVGLLAALCCACFCLRAKRRREKKRSQWTMTWKTAASAGGGPVSFDTEAAWVAEATSGAAASSPVVMFEKPLMELTFSDLVLATSGFGRESLLAEGCTTGPIYRAVLPGDIHVAIKVLEAARGVDEAEARAAFHELAGLKHANLLPLLGYCIAGREKLLLHEYMENGDLRRWLHELPPGRPIVDDCTAEAWEECNRRNGGGGASVVATASRALESGWETRYRVALGIARGLAFLHHAAGTRPVVHGDVNASNVLLDDDFEPRLTGFGVVSSSVEQRGGASTAADVYGYGVVLMELLSGRAGSDETVDWIRASIKKGNGSTVLDTRILDGSEPEEREMVEALRVGYLCTAESPEKRPSMGQVVGLLKDVRPLAVG